jgi:hypothetical protein
VPLDIAAVQEAWPAFEAAFDSLQGRRMMGLVRPADRVYRMASIRLERDSATPVGMDETVIPGGAYLRLRLRGGAPGVYELIEPAFEALFDIADHDPDRPHIEHYRAQTRERRATRGRTPLSWGPEAVDRSYCGQELAESLMAADTGCAGQTYFL